MMGVFNVVDLFSGAGGMSYGFKVHGAYRIVAAIDREIAKPSSGVGSLECNKTYEANIGIRPIPLDIGSMTRRDIEGLRHEILGSRSSLDVLLACPPCTGFSRIRPTNRLGDDPRNSLVARLAIWAEVFRPRVIVIENARELLTGRFSYHFLRLRSSLEALGYDLRTEVERFDRYGLPQIRERAICVAALRPLRPRLLSGLWAGLGVRRQAVTVRRAIGWLPPVKAGEKHPADPMHVSPRLAQQATRRRMELIPKDGGSWVDLLDSEEGRRLLTPALQRYAQAGKFGCYPDVYGRLKWDAPAVTIKRECAHPGNGRYTHPEQDRLLTVREMALLQGFPKHYVFAANSLANMYRHIGDAVPPLISYQIAHLVYWILSGIKPPAHAIVLQGTSLLPEDIITLNYDCDGASLSWGEAGALCMPRST